MLNNLIPRTDAIDELAEILKGLAEPTRLKILLLLKDAGHPVCVRGISKHLGITESAVSQHLKVLRRLKFVEAQRNGYFVHYAWIPKSLIEVSEKMRSLLS